MRRNPVFATLPWSHSFIHCGRSFSKSYCFPWGLPSEVSLLSWLTAPVYFIKMVIRAPSEIQLFCVLGRSFCCCCLGGGILFICFSSFKKYLSHCFGHITVLGSRIPHGPLSLSQHGADPRRSLSGPGARNEEAPHQFRLRCWALPCNSTQSLLVSAVRNV